MPKLYLENYTDRQIVEALMDIDIAKFLAVMQALANISERMQRRAETISNQMRDNDIDRLIGGENA